MGSNKAYLSLWGLYQYDDTIFDYFRIPESLDRETLIDNLILECAELEIIYPDASFLKLAIGSWSKKELTTWNKLLETTQYEYNPIWNKDGTIRETETRNLHNANSGRSENNIDGYSNSEQNNTNTMKVSAYDSDDFENREQNTTNGEVTSTDISNTEQKYDNTSDDTGTIIHERIEQGNIGMTSTQQLIKEEREIVSFNIMNHIIDSFKKRFCLLIY